MRAIVNLPSDSMFLIASGVPACQHPGFSPVLKCPQYTLGLSMARLWSGHLAIFSLFSLSLGTAQRKSTTTHGRLSLSLVKLRPDADTNVRSSKYPMAPGTRST
eukprot:4352336-Amphidinium_carterae.1